MRDAQLFTNILTQMIQSCHHAVDPIVCPQELHAFIPGDEDHRHILRWCRPTPTDINIEFFSACWQLHELTWTWYPYGQTDNRTLILEPTALPLLLGFGSQLFEPNLCSAPTPPPIACMWMWMLMWMDCNLTLSLLLMLFFLSLLSCCGCCCWRMFWMMVSRWFEATWKQGESIRFIHIFSYIHLMWFECQHWLIPWLLIL